MEPSEDDDHSQNKFPRPLRGRGGEVSPVGLRRPNMILQQQQQQQHIGSSSLPPQSSDSISSTAWQKQEQVNNYPNSFRRPNMPMSINKEITDLTHQTHQLSLNNSQQANIEQCDGQKYNGSYGGAGDPGNQQFIYKDVNHQSSTSKLNPYAQDFVPRSFISTVQQQKQPDTQVYQDYQDYQRYPLYQDATNDYNINGYYEEGASEYSYPYEEEGDFMAVRCLKEFIDQISVRPNKYEHNLGILTDTVNSWIDEDEPVMQSVVDVIMDQAIIETQFRYNGVRLCIHFMQKLKPYNNDPDKSFKNLLFARCQRETDVKKREDLIKTATGEAYLRGLTLFIGDLYSRCSENDLAECLPLLLETLVKHSNSDNLKCVCQVLKLCGSKLEEYFQGKNSNEVEQIIKNLSSHSNSTDVSTYTRELITSVVEMHERKWAAAVPKNTVPIKNPYLNNNPHDHGSTSNEIEEYNSYSDEDDYQTSYDFGSCGDEENKDVCDAFEEFLRNSGQSN